VWVQDRCVVCTEHTTCLEIVLDVPLLDDVHHTKSHFGLFEDSVSIGAR
jgi:hypothetical protein